MIKKKLPVDQTARDKAQAALAKINAHEDTCAERWSQAHASMMRVEDAVTSLNRKFWQAACALIGALLGLVFILLPLAL